MQEFSDTQAQFTDAINSCRAILSHGPKDHARWQRDARAAVQRLFDLMEKSQCGGGELGLPLPWEIQSDLISFINTNLQRAYLFNRTESITALPAPAKWLRTLQDFADDLGPAQGLAKSKQHHWCDSPPTLEECTAGKWKYGPLPPLDHLPATIDEIVVWTDISEPTLRRHNKKRTWRVHHDTKGYRVYYSDAKLFFDAKERAKSPTKKVKGNERKQKEKVSRRHPSK